MGGRGAATFPRKFGMGCQIWGGGGGAKSPVTPGSESTTLICYLEVMAEPQLRWRLAH